MINFIEEHREDLGVEPVCKVLPIAQSTFYAHAAIARDPGLASDRAKRDAVLCPEIKRVWEDNNEVYGSGLENADIHLRNPRILFKQTEPPQNYGARGILEFCRYLTTQVDDAFIKCLFII